MGFAPAAAAVVGTGLQIAGTVADMRRQRAQADAEAEAAKKNARLAARDARVAEQNALEEMQAVQIEGQEWGEDASIEIGQVIAERAASGTLMMGSNAAVVDGMRMLAQRDQQRIRMEGMVRYRAAMHQAKNIRQQRANYQIEASSASSHGRDATIGGMLNIGSSIIGGAQAYQQAKGL